MGPVPGLDLGAEKLAQAVGVSILVVKRWNRAQCVVEEKFPIIHNEVTIMEIQIHHRTSRSEQRECTAMYSLIHRIRDKK